MKLHLAVLVVLLALAVGDKASNGADPQISPKQVARVKLEIQKYLYVKTGSRPDRKVTPKGEPWIWCRKQFRAAKNNSDQLYKLISNHLAVADARYLKSRDIETRRKGLGMAVEACNCAKGRLKDPMLATAICQAYLLPNLDCCDPFHWNYLGKVNVLEVIVDAYAEARDAPNFIAALKLVLENAHNRNTADAARMRLAQALVREKKYQEAIDYLKAIDDNAGVGGAKRLIPDIEKEMGKK